jgi:hypothetical protein
VDGMHDCRYDLFSREYDSLEAQEFSPTSKAKCLQPGAKWSPCNWLFYLDDVRENFEIMSGMIPIRKSPCLFRVSQREQIYQFCSPDKQL